MQPNIVRLSKIRLQINLTLTLLTDQCSYQKFMGMHTCDILNMGWGKNSKMVKLNKNYVFCLRTDQLLFEHLKVVFNEWRNEFLFSVEIIVSVFRKLHCFLLLNKQCWTAQTHILSVTWNIWNSLQLFLDQLL